ncbi:hypothetical protein SDC9_148052 [bioreactor metagenome]|uniref:Uncharacterized protein n=1 Tax=bioreactor metagenome TaxID=1076179 RepID=A0A645EJG5_9ZZZZ
MKVIFLSTTSRSLWFGITIKVSTVSAKASIPSSADCIRRIPSKAKGLVTTATVKAPASFAISAMMGEAPVPVPPPIPAVIKTISVSKRRSFSFSRLSSAAVRPTSGSAPAPRPRVKLLPICNFVSAFEVSKA